MLKEILLKHVWLDIINSQWNEYAHWILRWWYITWPNYNQEYIKKFINCSNGVKNPSIIIDTNHDNSWKNPFKQIEIMQEVLKYIIPMLESEWIKARKIVKWFLVESYLIDSELDKTWKLIKKDEYKRWESLTDPCIWIEKTREFIYRMYDMI
jgi:3-deoxy-7-phosphoheptulonate synthase